MNLFKLVGTLAIEGVDKSKKQLDEVGGQTESTGSRMISTFKKIGAAIGTYFVADKIKDFCVTMVQSAAAVQAETAQFEAAFKDLSNSATEMFKSVSEETGIFATRLQVTGTKAFSQFKGAGMEANEALKKTETFLGLAADAAAYYDISLEDAEARIRSFLRGNVEAGDAIGLFTSEAQRNSYAVEMYGNKWVKLTEEQKQNLMLNIAKDIYDQAGATGQAAREADGLANVTGNLKEVWRQFLAKAGEPVLQTIVIPVMQKLTDFVTLKLMPALEGLADKFTTYITPAIQTFKDFVTTNVIPILQSLWDWIGQIINFVVKWKDELLITGGVIIGFVATLGLMNLVNNIALGFKNANTELMKYTAELVAANTAGVACTATLGAKSIVLNVLQGNISITTGATMLWKKAQDKLNLSLSSNPIGAVVMAVVALIAILVTAYKTNDDFRSAVNELWKTLKENLKPIFESLMPLIKELFDLFKSVWSLISALVIPIFNNFVQAITNTLKIVTPILSVLLKVFNACFQPVITIITKVVDIIGKIITKIAEAVTAVSGGIGKIRGLFDFKWKLPELKMPKFSVSPKGWTAGDLLKGKIPKLKIEWFADGGILDEPTIFGYNPVSGALRVGGEAGKEAVAPIDTLMGYVQAAVKAETGSISAQMERLLNMLSKYFPEMLEAAKNKQPLDENALARKLAPAMNTRFGEINKLNERGAM